MSTNAADLHRRAFEGPALKRAARSARRALARTGSALIVAARLAAKPPAAFWRFSFTPLGRFGWTVAVFAGLLGALAAADRSLDARREEGERRSAASGEGAVADPAVATIAGRAIRLSEVVRFGRAQGLVGGEEQVTAALAFEREVVQRYVEQRVLARAAAAEGLDDEADVRAAIADARLRILASRYYERRLADAVGEEKVTAVYRKMRGLADLGDEVRARFILMKTKEEAAAAAAEARSGADFDTLARARSIDPRTAALGGRLGWFTADMMAPTLAEAAFATPPGQVSDPFETEFGWGVVKVEERRKRTPPSLRELRPEIEEFLKLEAVDALLSELTDRFYVEYRDPRATTGTAVGNDASGAREGAP